MRVDRLRDVAQDQLEGDLVDLARRLRSPDTRPVSRDVDVANSE